MTDLLTAFGLIALAELGDKSQLLALTFATRYRWWQVLTGVGVAALALLGLSAALGGALGAALPQRAIATGGGLLFLAFAAWTAFDADDEVVDGADRRSGRSVIVTVVVAFIVAELGDKTMIGTAALASARDPIAVWLGAAAGMTVASGAAIAVGRLLHRRLPADRLRLVSAVAFAVFGMLLLVEGLRG
ncbi:TMEM165/GDT1 family protein [Nitriliruptor alkaliphilus]|uniref:TMEM165/GDT1 family protein n=1 Tax=Nitriliruptor alkaliphilus TaxID=427918 RepID=UPI0006966ABF|nr:TMEM165/GDT1 family protein [Nitriliruptor alkaliphilus]